MNLQQLKYFWSLIPNTPGCKGCGNCCKIAPFIKSEYITIQEYLRGNKQTLPEKGIDGYCSALALDNKCLIYPVRPTICRLWGTQEITEFKIKGRAIELNCKVHPEANLNFHGDSRYQHYLRLYLLALNTTKTHYMLGFTEAELQAYLTRKK